MLSDKIRAAAILLATSPLLACTGASIYAPLPQTGFTAPNSTVAPVTRVRGTASRSYFALLSFPVVPDARLQREATFNALQGSGGDLIVDASYSAVVTTFGPYARVDRTVEGTAARIVQVGARPLQ